MTVSLSLRSERDHIELLVSHYERYFAADEYITGSIHISVYDSSSVTGFWPSSILFSKHICLWESDQRRRSDSRMDVTVVLFPLWVLQFLVIHPTISFEKSSVNRSWLSDGLALTKLDRLDFQFVIPLLKYIKSAGKTKNWNRRDLDEANQRVSTSELIFTNYRFDRNR